MSILSKLFNNMDPERNRKVIHRKFCDFKVFGKFGEFKGRVLWCGGSCDVLMEPDDAESGYLNAEKALSIFDEVYENKQEWDRKVKECAAAEFMDGNGMVSTGGDGKVESEVTSMQKEEFIGRLAVNRITVLNSGELSFRMSAGGLLDGRDIEVDTDISGESMFCSRCR